MTLGNPKPILYQGSIYRINIYIESFAQDYSGLLPSGESASLDFIIKVNGSTVSSHSVVYDETKQTDIILDESVDLDVFPEDIVTIEYTENFPSGYTYTYSGINVKTLCSKLYY